MSECIRRALLGALLAFSSVTVFAVDYGRTEGSFGVSPAGAATYSIPIWTPPGPNGVTPSLSLSYSSQGGNGLAGVGWNLNAALAIERCTRTKHQDGNAGGIELSANDRFCIGGNCAEPRFCAMCGCSNHLAPSASLSLQVSQIFERLFDS
jgi:hypothetical protein